jgi:hypothetical protein
LGITLNYRLAIYECGELVMTHPSIQKAREMLARRHEQEAAHEVWRAEHADELSDARLEQLRAQRSERQRSELIYKTHDNGPPPQVDLRSDLIEELREELKAYALEAAGTAAEAAGEELGKLEARMAKIEKALIERGLRLLKNDAA